jgi:hypothetical protein
VRTVINDRPALWVPTPGCPCSVNCFHSGLRVHCDRCVRNEKRPQRDEFAPIPVEV